MIDADRFPSGWLLEAAADLRRRDDGRVLIGGSPLRILRLSDAGARAVTRWFAGEPVGTGEQHRALARRLVDAGMATSTPPLPFGGDRGRLDLTVVIPVKDDPEGLRRTLLGLQDLPVVVVDDGSTPPLVLPSPSPVGHRIIRRPTAGGPAAARTAGSVGLSTSLVAFVDAGVTVTEADLGRLAVLFDDPELAAAAPRVASDTAGPAAGSLIGRYEQHRSPLDLGPTAAVVGPGRRVAYVPSACLLVRRAVLVRSGGFDERLRYGEDVDLIWRLSRDHTIRYEPAVTAHHPPRPSLRTFVRQRFGYGSAAGPLGVRHGADVSPVRTSGWSLGVVALLAAGHPGAAVGLAAGTAVALVPKLGALLPDPGVEAALLTARGHGWTLRSMAQASVRTWWPVSMLSLLSGVGRRTTLAFVAVGWAQRLLDRTPEPAVDLVLGVVDDLSYGAGVWVGSLRNRTIRPLLPHLLNWPPPD